MGKVVLASGLETREKNNDADDMENAAELVRLVAVVFISKGREEDGW